MLGLSLRCKERLVLKLSIVYVVVRFSQTFAGVGKLAQVYLPTIGTAHKKPLHKSSNIHKAPFQSLRKWAPGLPILSDTAVPRQEVKPENVSDYASRNAS